MIHWNSFSDFLAMGGYGLYVWGSFGVTAIIMIVEPIVDIRRRNTLIVRLKRQLRAEKSAHKGTHKAGSPSSSTGEVGKVTRSSQ